ncbi:bifunctional diguanylate cyclase/phosphodiesterase [Actinoplanes sp. NPDC051861]|uniref:putative bifunctional diguanylate cyclase/phosphodiesterase n=1 Tax=Actinoplanes sp. NPDC051861 TaxID=3155170 RepID=UPI00342E0750
MTSVLLSAAIAVYSVIAVAANLAGPREPLLLLWLAAPLSTVIPAVIATRIVLTPRFPRPTRRFWAHLAGCAALCGVAAVMNIVDAIGGEEPTQVLSPWTVAVYGVAVLVLLVGMFRLPLDASGRGDRLRVALDGGTVLLAATVFMWQFVSAPMLEASGYHATQLIAVGFTLVLELVTVFAIVKVAIAGRAYVAAPALRLFAIGLIIGVLSGVVQGLTVDRPHLSTAQFVIPIVMICATAAAEAQLRATPAPPRRSTASQRSYSVLPYLAIAGVDAVLICVAWPHADLRVVLCAAVALAAMVVSRQITTMRENAELVDRLDHSSTHDPLTGLPNRALFNERLAAAIAHGPAAVALIDLDDFKTVNDTLGHGAGDLLLVSVAQRLSESVRPQDTVARLGGDEFVVLLVGVGADEASRTAQRMIGALAAPVLAGGHELLARASIGLADNHDGGDAGEMLRQADIAMYAAKHGGGSDVQCYTPGMAGAVAHTAALGAELEDAIADGRMVLEYQPIVELDGTLIGAEALVRWQHPERGTLPPAEFVPVAERTGAIVPLGEWVLRTACTELGPLTPVAISVNVSARELSSPGFAERVTRVLEETGVPPHRLTLEITESAAGTVAPLSELRRRGVRIALDDFGTGTSSLTLLHALPLDRVKLDSSFLHGAAGVLALAAASGLEVVAERVETAAQATRLAELGCHAAQGFHFAPPMPASAITALAAPSLSR